MDRLERDALLLALVDKLRENGSWCGETHIQKASYMLEQIFEHPLGFDFILYKHGPYSFTLKDEIKSMRADYLLGIEPQHPYGPSIYSTKNSDKIKIRYSKLIEQYNDAMDFIMKYVGNKKVNELEKLATALYITYNENTDADKESRAKDIHKIKPHIKEEEARESIENIDEIINKAKNSGLLNNN